MEFNINNCKSCKSFIKSLSKRSTKDSDCTVNHDANSDSDAVAA
jgi:hypothetical protein